MEVRAGEVAGLDQVVELVEVLLKLVNGFMQTGFDQVVDPHIAPAGQELSAQTVEVIRRVLARVLLDLLQGVADALEAVPHRPRKGWSSSKKRATDAGLIPCWAIWRHIWVKLVPFLRC